MPSLWAWPIQRLTRQGMGQVVGWEFFLGDVGVHRQERLRPSLPDGERLQGWLLWLFRVSASLDGFLILPWAVRSHDQGEAFLRWWQGAADVPEEWKRRLVVPIHPASFVAEVSQLLGSAGVRRAAEGEPYLHRRAVGRLGLTAQDLVLISPLPDVATPGWIREVAALGLGRIPVVARGVVSRPLLSRLARAGIAYATGRAVLPPLAVTVGPYPGSEEA